MYNSEMRGPPGCHAKEINIDYDQGSRIEVLWDPTMEDEDESLKKAAAEKSLIPSYDDMKRKNNLSKKHLPPDFHIFLGAAKPISGGGKGGKGEKGKGGRGKSSGMKKPRDAPQAFNEEAAVREDMAAVINMFKKEYEDNGQKVSINDKLRH